VVDTGIKEEPVRVGPVEPVVKPVEPVETEWRTIFDGARLDPWRKIGGSVSLENGEMVLGSDADVYYESKWNAFEMSFEIKLEGKPSGEAVFGIGVFQFTTGRGKHRVRISFYNDGDIHIDGPQNIRRMGGGALKLNDWTKLVISADENNLKLMAGGNVLFSVGVNQLDKNPGGIYFYTFSGVTARIRNIKVRNTR